MGHGFRRLLSVLVVIAFAGAAPVAADAAERRELSGSIELEAWSLAAGFGWQWGSGILRLTDGTLHPFTVHGLDVLAIGLSRFEAQGFVYGLDDLADFSGFYGGGEVGIGAIQSASAITLANNKGVVISLETDGRGYRLQLGPKAMNIELYD